METAQVLAPQSRGQELLKRGLSALHEALADYILMYPHHTLRQMGAYFGYSQSWLSVVTNSDMFKAYFAKRRVEVSTMIAQDLPSKIEIAAHMVTDKLIEMIPNITDSEEALDVFDKVLHRAGYAPNSKSAPVTQVNQQNNVFYLTKEDLKQVKGTLIENHAAPLPAPIAQSEEQVIAQPVPAT